MFGIDLIHASLLPAMLVALTAGVLSFVSPCVLPIVPPYLAYMGGISVSDMQRGKSPLPAAICFVLGLSTVFILLGLGVSALGLYLGSIRDTLATVMDIVVMIFGAHFLGLFRIRFLDRDLRIDAGAKGGSVAGAFVLGLTFGFGWAPCLGPQLGSILNLASQQGSLSSGTFLLGVYTLGLGIPFLLVAAFFPRMTPLINFLKRHFDRIEKIMGLMLWTTGLLMLTGGFTVFSLWLTEHIPALAVLG